MTTNNNNSNGNTFGYLRPKAQIDDLITIEGYESRVFQVTAYTHEMSFDKKQQEETILYDVIDVQSNEYEIAFDEDVTVVCRAEQADEYIANMTTHEPNKPRKKGGKQDEEQTPSKSEQVDSLLDQLRSAQALRPVYEGDRKYELAVCEIKAKLRDLTENTTKGGR